MAEFITAEGLEIPTLEDLTTEVEEEQKAAIDPLLGTGADTVIGQFNGTHNSHLREGWEALRVAFTSLNPADAEGAILDGVCAFTGTTRNEAKPSRFKGTKKITVNLDAGTVVEAGVTSFHVVDRPDIVFTLVADDSFDTDGTYTAGVTGNVSFEAVCTQTGPIAVNAGTLTQIATPLAGLNSVTNPTDAILGSAVEVDESLRTRREQEIRQQGSCTTAALKADLIALEDENGEKPIRSVQILENEGDEVDANGLPAHSFEAVIWDGPGEDAEDADVTAVVAASKPAGIKPVGDSGTNPPWSRAAQRPVEIEVSLRFKAGVYAGDDAVKTAIATDFAAYQEPSNGDDQLGIVPFSRYLGEALKIQGVTRVVHVKLNFTGFGVFTNQDITPGVREVAVTDTADITVISVAE
jgi:uncharacterized phage protein gp47/JayE